MVRFIDNNDSNRMVDTSTRFCGGYFSGTQRTFCGAGQMIANLFAVIVSPLTCCCLPANSGFSFKNAGKDFCAGLGHVLYGIYEAFPGTSFIIGRLNEHESQTVEQLAKVISENYPGADGMEESIPADDRVNPYKVLRALENRFPQYTLGVDISQIDGNVVFSWS